jgi:FtsZ-binding cell division protein ZapB
MIDPETIRCWRINYGLDKRTPEDAGRWWAMSDRGMAPAGAVAALGLALNEIESLRETNNRLNRRASVAEGAVLNAARAGGPNLGRALANAACGPLRSENAELREQIKALKAAADIADMIIEDSDATRTIRDLRAEVERLKTENAALRADIASRKWIDP